MNADADQLTSHRDELEALRESLEKRLQNWLPEAPASDRVAQAMREGTLTPGKRVRPLLLILAAQDLGDKVAFEGLLDLACAVEMVHAASLILDDIPCMDNAALRRGRPTIHRQFGESVAILAAVALLSRAYAIVAEAPGLDGERRAAAVSRLAGAVGLQGLVQGQFLDLSEGGQRRDVDAILTTNELKTSKLFSATLALATLAADADEPAQTALLLFAEELGQAFQLIDDLADGVMGTGKDLNQDAGKSTLVATLGEAAVRKRLDAHLARADAHLATACPQGGRTRAFVESWFRQQLAVIGAP
ncbi:polyprenyl synthetase family protein [Halomonas sp. HNIBRBA4712]|uniref:polyprenyl synthetase family protein n=1 Tax=Halomonas sp. HNIBRBA4712 TaxID=3373087 RepID=UPI003746BABA